MPLALNDRVQQTGTANTTVSFTLSGSVTGFQTFAVIGNGNTTYYSSFDGSGNWEVGLGTYSTTGPTLTRTTIYASSNSNTAVTFSGTVNVFVTYPSSRSVYEDASGNVSPLGTITSGVWNGTTIGTAYGGTGVTSSSGANSVVLRDASANVTFNNFVPNTLITTASAGTTVLTVASARNQILVGSTTHTFRLPDATTLALGQSFLFINNSSGNLTVIDNALAVVEVVPPGGITQKGAVSIATTAGTWGAYSFIPAAVNWGTDSLALGTTVISGGTWQGGTIASGYGGTGLTTFAAANNALYSTSASTLAAGTLPVAAGGTGLTTLTANYIPYGNGTSAYQSVATFTFNGTTLATPSASLSGNLTFTGTANRITGDYSNATFTSRVAFQTSVTNGNSNVTLLPNGTGLNAFFRAYGSSDPTNASEMSAGVIGTSEVRFQSGITGTGTYLPLTFYNGGSERMRISTGGVVTIPNLTASQAVFTDASDNLVSVATTGSGNVVLATSPTLVSPALGTPSSGTLTNCTFPTLNQNTTGTAANVTGIVAVANGGTGASNNGTARTNLGATTVGSNFFTLTNPSAITFPRMNADNTVSSLDAATFRTAIGATTVGSNFFALTNPSAITFPRMNADNTVSALDASTFRTAIGAGTGSGTVTSVTGTSPVASSGGTTPAISLSSGYGDTQNPYASKTANTFLAAPNGAAGVPSFRAVVAADIPSATSGNWFSGIARVAGDGVMEVGRYIDFHSTNAGTSDFDVRMDCSGSNAISFGGATVTATTFSGALNGNATTATTATNQSGGTVSATTGSFSGVASFADGSAAAPSITNTGDTNTGIFFPAADTMSFATNSAERMSIDSTGSVGINATPSFLNKLRISDVYGPDYGGNQLAVIGEFVQPDGPASAGITLVADSTTLNFFASDSSNLTGLMNPGARDMTFGTNNSERMRINGSNGNIAIGDSVTNTSKLYVNGQITARYNSLSNIGTACDFSTNHMFKVSVSGNKTLTATVPPSGTQAIVMLSKTNTSAATITFGTGFKSTGTVVTGTTSGAIFVISFVSDGSFLWEASRTTQMV